MLYKTMVLEIIQQYPETCDRLCRQRRLLPELERYAIELKERHDVWTTALAQTEPGRPRSQVASEALEIALKDLAHHFASASPPDQGLATTIETATAQLSRHTPTA